MSQYMNESQLEVASVVEEARREARARAMTRCEYESVRPYAVQWAGTTEIKDHQKSSTWWLYRPSMKSIVDYSCAPETEGEMTFEEERRLLINLEMLPDERMRKVWHIIQESPGVTREAEESMRSQNRLANFDALDAATLWRLHRYVNSCYKEEALRELRKTMGLGCAFCGYKTQGCSYCNPNKERRIKAKVACLAHRIGAVTDQLHWLRAAYEKQMMTHGTVVAQTGRNTALMQDLEDQAVRTVKTLDKLREAERSYCRKVVSDKLSILPHEKILECHDMIRKGTSRDALYECGGQRNGRGSSSRRDDKVGVNFAMLDEQTMREVNKFVNKALGECGIECFSDAVTFWEKMEEDREGLMAAMGGLM
ncbi:hypothetical protein HOP50_20g86050 [Chloropicon primus]|nr:hypothetical protein HOP50_20g86050 [Chloropicon primus]